MKPYIGHFQKTDPILFALSQKISIPAIKQSDDYFSDLCKIIIGQQLSDKAGNTLVARFRHLLPHGRIHEHGVMHLSEEAIRLAGISRFKAQFLKTLAQAVVSKVIDLPSLVQRTDQDVITTLTKIRGIGPWTADMFLMFTLGRTDVFSYGDLGLQNAVCRLYHLEKPLSRNVLDTLVLKWRPYRTYACLLLWKSLELPEADLPKG